MARSVFGLVGAIMALFPDAVLEAFESATLENPEESQPKPWLVSGIRAEGVVYAVASVAGGKGYAWLMKLVGIVGVVVAIFPERYLEAGKAMAYENPEDLEWRDELVTAARGLGVLCVLLALAAGRRR